MTSPKTRVASCSGAAAEETEIGAPLSHIVILGYGFSHIRRSEKVVAMKRWFPRFSSREDCESLCREESNWKAEVDVWSVWHSPWSLFLDSMWEGGGGACVKRTFC